MQNFLEFLNDYDSSTSENPCRGEISLWRAVIGQALIDITTKHKKYHKVNYYEAIRWLTGNSPDFKRVCSYAGLDPDFVRQHVKRFIIKNNIRCK